MAGPQRSFGGTRTGFPVVLGDWRRIQLPPGGAGLSLPVCPPVCCLVDVYFTEVHVDDWQDQEV